MSEFCFLFMEIMAVLHIKYQRVLALRRQEIITAGNRTAYNHNLIHLRAQID